ncbi:MAG: hypothetical protein CGU28_03475 [Candidatus Dactylopiibacterium carminicum]|nr:MAG: hypothetical protein CGU28_03475 [Candidatus Dactylopiibacterium carminicum]
MKHKQIRRRHARALALAMAGVFQGSHALADDQVLAPVTVTDSVPSEASSTIPAEVIEARRARNLNELLQGENGVTVGSGTAIAQKIYLRGIEDSMLNTTLDGAAQSGRAFHHQSRLLLDPELIKQVEIDRGSSPASAGPGALAGSLRLTTKNGRDLLRSGQTFGGIVRGGVASNEGSHYGASLYGLAGETVDFLLSGNRADNKDYEDGGGQRQHYSAATETSGLAKFNWRPAQGHELSLGYQSVENEGTRYLRPNFWEGQGNSLMPQTTQRDTLTAAYRFAGDDVRPALDINVFADEMQVERTAEAAMPQFNKPLGYRFGEKLSSDGINALAISKIAGSTLRYGLNHHTYRMSAINPRPPVISGSSGQERSKVTGVFAESETPLLGHFLLGLGARYDWYGYTDNHGQEFSSDGLSPNASLTWLATDALSFRLASSRTLRGAGLKEGFYVDNMRWRNAADLQEETAKNHEIGFTYAEGPWHLKGALFRMQIENFITTTTGSSWLIDNVGTMKSNGYELGGGWQQGDFRTGLSVAHARPKLNGYNLGDEAYGLGVSTGRSWHFNFGHTWQAWNLDLEWMTRVVERHKTTEYLISESRAVTKNKAGYAVHDLYANWHPLGKDRVRVTFSVRNLFDKSYYDQASFAYYVDAAGIQSNRGFAEPGRDLRLDLSWKF